MEEEIKELWVDKWCPHTIDDLVLDDKQKNYFKNMLASKDVVHILLSGHAGIGKTTIAKIIAKECNAVTMFLPCGIEGTVATAQGKLKSFCDSVSIDGRPKVIILDELDSASGTQDNSFQKVLRNLIESSQSDCRFIATCNFQDKVIQPLKSRCIPIDLKFSAKDLLGRIKTILDAEKIKYTQETLKDFVVFAIKRFYPDIRAIINHLQPCCSTGELIVSTDKVAITGKESFIKELFTRLADKPILEVRKFYIQNNDKFSNDYLTFASDVMNYALDNSIVSDPAKILKCTSLVYQLNQVIDKELGFFALMCFFSNAK